MSLDESQPATLSQALSRAATLVPDREAVVCGSERVTYQELNQLAQRLATVLCGVGVEPGGAVAIWMPNSVGHAAAIFGAARLGTVVPVHVRYTVGEVLSLLTANNASALLAAPQLAAPAESELRSFGVPLLLVDPSGVVHAEHADSLRRPAPDPTDIAMIQFTSGTTSRSKGVMLGGSQLVRNATELATRLDVQPGDRYASAMPFYHIGGSILTLLLATVRLATTVTLESFDPDALAEAIGREKCTHLFGVESMFLSMLENDALDTADLSTIRVCFAGGRPAVLDEVAHRVGGRLVNRYGLTEASGNVTTSLHGESHEIVRATMGFPLPGLALRIVDPETQAPLGPNTPGEIQVRGWGVAKGYLDDPEATSRTFLPDGWLRTGDMGLLDDQGRLVYQRRMGDVLRVGSENVAALEVESILVQHPNVVEAAVIGVAHDRMGQVPIAFVQARTDTSPDCANDIVEHCAAHLASFKVPRQIVWMSETEWPRSSNGKIRKSTLADLIAEDTQEERVS